MNIIKRISKIYIDTGFEILRENDHRAVYKNKYSIHYAYSYDSISEAHEKWNDDHQSLIDDYKTHEGPRDLEWNFYAVFFINSPVTEEFEKLRVIIQTNTAFSRKFMYSRDEINELPPGSIPLNQTPVDSLLTTDLIGEWKKTLGNHLFEIVVNGPKSGIEERYSKYIEESKSEQ